MYISTTPFALFHPFCRFRCPNPTVISYAIFAISWEHNLGVPTSLWHVDCQATSLSWIKSSWHGTIEPPFLASEIWGRNHQRGIPNSWLVYKGKSHMDDN